MTRGPGLRPPTDDAVWDACRAWASSGVMALCGHEDGPPLLPPLAMPARLGALVDEIEELSRAKGTPVRVCWEAALAGRAALLGLSRHGRTSANGTCRLLDAADGQIALSLPRPDDLDMVPALTCGAVSGDPWEAVARAASATPAAGFVDRARLLGLGAGVPGERLGGDPYAADQLGEKHLLPAGRPWTVLDLSSLWAGPLAARILAEAGARVTKVEDPARLDGARHNPAFYSWIHSQAESNIRIEFQSPDGQQELAHLLAGANVVIEASRPRALEQMGLSPEQRGLQPGQVWVSVTAHGRHGSEREWIGFGDDAAIAGGLFCNDSSGRPVFCGDAVADPITGLVAALAALRSLRDGGGQLIDVPLSACASWAAAGDVAPQEPTVERSGDGWVLRLAGRSVPVAGSPPHLDIVERP